MPELIDLDRERQERRDEPIDFSLPPVMAAREAVIGAARAVLTASRSDFIDKMRALQGAVADLDTVEKEGAR